MGMSAFKKISLTGQVNRKDQNPNQGEPGIKADVSAVNPLNQLRCRREESAVAARGERIDAGFHQRTHATEARKRSADRRRNPPFPHRSRDFLDSETTRSSDDRKEAGLNP